jgi:hypothetical protein
LLEYGHAAVLIGDVTNAGNSTSERATPLYDAFVALVTSADTSTGVGLRV